MKRQSVYLAYPIDQINKDQAQLFVYIETFKMAALDPQRCAVSWVYDPGDAFKVAMGAPIERGLAHINRVALNQADVLVAFLPKDTPTVGVPMEIADAVSQGMRVFVVSDADSWSLALSGVERFYEFGGGTISGILASIHDAAMDRDHVKNKRGMPVYFTQDQPRAQLPSRAHDDDAGLDLYVSETTTILPGEFKDVPTGLSVELPAWQWGMVTGRSSALRVRGLLVHTGVIDTGYRGPLFAGAWNMTPHPVTVDAGERIAQLIMMSNMTQHVLPVIVPELSPSTRGVAGFGSSGS